jgi:hypothetical protein
MVAYNNAKTTKPTMKNKAIHCSVVGSAGRGVNQNLHPDKTQGLQKTAQKGPKVAKQQLESCQTS